MNTGDFIMLRFTAALLFLLFSFSPLFAVGEEEYGRKMSGAPYESWEEGGNDFFVMFNTLLEDNVQYKEDTSSGELNPQGDTCLEESSFTLSNNHIPDDAIIDKAYLVWMGAVEPKDELEENENNMLKPTDNVVRLDFSAPSVVENDVELFSSYTYGVDVQGGTNASVGNRLDDEPGFEFEGFHFTPQSGLLKNCSENSDAEPVSYESAEIGYFTYRKDITSFFAKIQEDGKLLGGEGSTGKLDGQSLYGTYTFSGLDCTDHEYYRCNTTMLSGWSILLVYRSGQISSKKIYLYDGFSFMKGTSSYADVSGFELPKNPVFRLTAVTGEGDPATLRSPSYPDEAISIKGGSADSYFPLINECNTYKNGVDDSNGYEIFNSNSSIASWDPSEDIFITCRSAESDESVNFGMDVDTFVLDAEKDENLEEHLAAGTTSMTLKFTVNSDAILTNFMVTSVDTRTPAFDIPPESELFPFPNDREKHFCACRDESETAGDYYCPDRPFYYFIKIQNWGTNVAENVKIIDDLDSNLEYVPGTTEVASNFNEELGYFDDWSPIEDGEGGVFPLSGEGAIVDSSIAKCNIQDYTCPETTLVRFLVKPKAGTPKHAVIENSAIISANLNEGGYKTNKSFPLQLRASNTCLSEAACPQPTKEQCGGVFVSGDGEPECLKDGLPDCPSPYTCNSSFKCVEDEEKMCRGATVKVAEGFNTPDSDSSILITKDNDGDHLVAGQFSITTDSCESDRQFSFDSLKVTLEKSDNNIVLSDLELYLDVNGDGVKDADDVLLSNTSAVTGTIAEFIIDEVNGERLLGKDKRGWIKGKTLHNFIVLAKVDYLGDTVGQSVSFNFYLGSSGSLEMHDAGNLNVNFTSNSDDGSIQFAEYEIEPDGNYFVVTRGANDPSVPERSEINSDIPVLQLRMKPKQGTNSITSIKFSVPEDDKYALFGEEIKKLSIYLDTDADGVGDGEPVGVITNFDGPRIARFKDLEGLDFQEGETKYLVVNCEFNLQEDSVARVSLYGGGIELQDKSLTPIGLPIHSKEFSAICFDEASCGELIDNSSPATGCECSFVPSEDGEFNGFAAFILLVAMAVIFSLRAVLIPVRNKDK
jgi:uncharacterized repeat protein (TIGR01451 family)